MAYYGSQGNQVHWQYNTSSAPSEVPPSYMPESNQEIEMDFKGGKKISILKVFVYVLVGFSLLGAVIYSNVQQLQISNSITEKKQEYVNLQSDFVRTQSKLAGKTSNKDVQEYAENVLGMCTVDGSQIEFVEIQKSDVVEIPAEEQNFFVKIKTGFDNFLEYLRG